MLVRDWMTQDPICCEPDETVLFAAKLMAESGASATLVTKNKRLVGIFTEHDLLKKVVSRELDPKNVKLQDVMTADPDTVDAEEDAMEAQRTLMDSHYRHMPVVENGKPVGILSLGSRLSS